MRKDDYPDEVKGDPDPGVFAGGLIIFVVCLVVYLVV